MVVDQEDNWFAQCHFSASQIVAMLVEPQWTGSEEELAYIENYLKDNNSNPKRVKVKVTIELSELENS